MKTGIGIIGCGVISNTYIRDLQRLFSNEIEIRAVADLDAQRAAGTAQQYNIPKACPIDELLQDPEIEIVVNLTPPAAHYSMNKQILSAGKNLFCEKPVSLHVAEAEELRDIAAEKGVVIGCAPDTIMGSSLRTCHKLLDDGCIGRPLYVNANMMNCGPETWHPAPENFYKEGGGPIYDMGGYYFTALTDFFGSAVSVYAVSGTGYPEREVLNGPRFGQTFPVQTPTYYAVILTMKSGVIVTMNFSFDIWKSTLPMFEVYGTDGTLEVPDPNMHGGVPRIYRREQTTAKCYGGTDTGNGEMFQVPELYQDVGEYVRGLGVADLARAIREGRKPVVDINRGIHVLEIMTGVMESARTGRIYEMKTALEG